MVAEAADNPQDYPSRHGHAYQRPEFDCICVTLDGVEYRGKLAVDEWISRQKARQDQEQTRLCTSQIAPRERDSTSLAIEKITA